MGKKILLADDSITIQKVIELTFSDEDFEVVTVGNGRLAVEKVQEVRPDLVLCDIIMPEKDGYEVCDFIKRTPTLSHIPVLLLTGAFEPFDQERAGRVGCDGFLAKPFEPQTLIAKVKDLLSRTTGARPAASPTLTQPPAFVAPPPPPPASSATEIYERPLFDEPSFEPATPAASPAPGAGPSFEPEFEPLEPEPLPIEPPPFRAQFTPTSPAAPPSEARPDDQAIPGLPPIEAVPFEPVPFEPVRLAEPEPLGFPAIPPAEPEVYFIPEEPYVASPPPAPAEPPEERSPVASSSVVDQYSVHSLDEAVAAVEEAAEPASDFYRAVETHEPELVPMTAEETASLNESPAPHAPSAQEPAWEPPPLVSWSQPTVEVPLEERARASMRSAQETEAVFEEVFEEEPAALPPVPSLPVFEAKVSAPPAAQAPSPQPEVATEESFEEIVPAPETADAAPSAAAEVAVPVDMVSQIAQRVIAQISEKVIREIAWEVIPDLAEALIKKEIERLKAELQES